jgi:small conductance mechanosensitive channel
MNNILLLGGVWTMSFDFNEIVTSLVRTLGTYGLRILAALALFFIGRKVLKTFIKGIKSFMVKKGVDQTLISFLGNLSYWALMAFLLITAVGIMGIQTSSLVAALGAAGLAVGLALQGSLSNFAAGVLIIIFRPFKVGDFIEAGGSSGTVKEITILTTVMTMIDNKKVIMPNSKIMDGTIVNYSANHTRRIDMVFGVSYGSDLDHVIRVLQSLIDDDERILKDPAPLVAVLSHGESSINLAVRVWVESPNVLKVNFDMQKKVKERFDQEGITIPFPQRTVRLMKE